MSVIFGTEENDIDIILKRITHEDTRRIISQCFGLMGLVLESLGKYLRSLESHNKALAIHTELNDTVGVGADHSNTGIVLRNMGRLEDALESHNKALAIRTELRNKIGTIINYNNIGLVFEKIHDINKAKNSFSKGLEILDEMERLTGNRHPHYDVLKRNFDRVSG